MIDGKINEQPRAAGVNGISKFTELLERGGAAVVFGTGGINRIEIHRCKRTAVAPHPGVRRGPESLSGGVRRGVAAAVAGNIVGAGRRGGPRPEGQATPHR